MHQYLVEQKNEYRKTSVLLREHTTKEEGQNKMHKMMQQDSLRTIINLWDGNHSCHSITPSYSMDFKPTEQDKASTHYPC